MSTGVGDTEQAAQRRESAGLAIADMPPEPVAFPLRILYGIARRCDALWLKRRLGAFGRGARLQRPRWLVHPESISLASGVMIWRYARLESVASPQYGLGKIEIGESTAIQPFVHIGAVERVSIGRSCLFGSHVFITDHDHRPSSPGDAVFESRQVAVAPVCIEDRVWLGEFVGVLKGVTIGEGSIVGAGSVVTRDLPPFSIATGSPARVIRRWDREKERWLDDVANSGG